jgi:hypothetical protein
MEQIRLAQRPAGQKTGGFLDLQGSSSQGRERFASCALDCQKPFLVFALRVAFGVTNLFQTDWSGIHAGTTRPT